MPSTSPAIVFVGFMGAGKSTIARRAGRELGIEVVDTDELIERESGRPIATIFSEHGEAGFRELEERITLEALERGGAVALGGGAVESERVRAALADHVTVWCRIDEELAWARCAGTERPLARDRDGFRRRFGAREPLYAAVARVILPSGGDVPDAGLEWIGGLREAPGVQLIWARSASGEYPAVVGPGATRLLAAAATRPHDPAAAGPLGTAAAPAAGPGARTFAVADRIARAAVGELMPDVAATIEADGGEEAKTIAAAERVLVELVRAGVRRDDALLAFGGGVVGDLAGFCAAVYQRGIPIVQVPTTLVAQVDSAYGGKTGVDLQEAKNYVGAYHQPAAVLADPAALATLPQEEIAAGFAEVVKTALIAGGPLWEGVSALTKVDAESVAPFVFDCARTKLDVVAADERDGGRRAVLNLGHTVGHAIEAASGYGRYRHGEAVGIGMLAALRLSGAGELRGQVGELLERAGLPVTLDAEIDVEEVLSIADRDKKATAAGLPFVLVEAPGNVSHGHAVDRDSLLAAVTELQTERQ